MANRPNSQGLLCKNPFFVNYVKMLCKHYYVNAVNADVPSEVKPAQTAISGQHAKTAHKIWASGAALPPVPDRSTTVKGFRAKDAISLF